MRSNFSRVFCASVAGWLVVGSAAVPCMADDLKTPLFDGFDGKVTLAWQPVREDKTHVSLTKHPGKLTITTQRGSIHADEKNDAYGGGIQAKNIYVIRNPLPKGGDFVITTCIEGFHPTTHYQQAGLIVYEDDDNYLKWGMEASSSARSGRSFTSLEETEQASRFDWIEAPAGLERFWLRMVKRGNRYQHAYSLDGKTFQVVGERAWGNGAPKFVGMLAKNGGNPDAADIDACFDFFELRPLTTEEKGHAPEVQRLRGTWIGVSRREDGHEVESPERFQFVFLASMEAQINEGERGTSCQFALDVTRKPRQLILSPAGDRGERKLLRMAYALDGDKLTICFDPRPNAPAPVALDTRPGDGRMLVTLKRGPQSKEEK
jgi:uncharacterized protein (TIGR03067 family)